MKNLFIILSLLLAFAMNADAQYRGSIRDTITTVASTADEISYAGTLTNRATAIGSARRFEQLGVMDIIGVCERTSGTPDGDLYIQTANATTPTAWTNLDTVAITGNDPIPFHFTYSEWTGLYLRTQMVAPSSTQVEHCYLDWKYTRKL